MNIGEIGETLRRNTVQVRNGQNGVGSGVIWGTSGIIVTNAHVVSSANVTVELWDGRAAQASLETRDLRRDLAILRIEASRLESARSGDSARLRPGELVIAVGNPLGFTGALSTGVVHGIGAVPGMGTRKFIQTTVRLAPGNSGGPLADAAGKVIGINTAVVSGGLGLAVPSADVQHLLTAGPPAELGVAVRPVRISGRDGGIGLLVLRVNPGGPADYASLRTGDLLIGASGRRFTSTEDLWDSLDKSKGSCVTLQFQRGDRSKKREVTVRLMYY